MEKSTFWTPRSKLASLRTKKGPKSLLKAIFHVSILPLDDSGGFWPKFWDRRKKLYIWAGITHMQFTHFQFQSACVHKYFTSQRHLLQFPGTSCLERINYKINKNVGSSDLTGKCPTHQINTIHRLPFMFPCYKSFIIIQ